MHAMRYDPQRHHRRSIRLTGHDYAQAGPYFVTICTQDRTCWFGEVADGIMHLNEAGRVAAAIWSDLPARFPGVATDAYVVMPNHIHGIIRIDVDAAEEGASNRAPTNDGPNPAGAQSIAPDIAPHDIPTHAPTLGAVVRAFKAVSARTIRQTIAPRFAWQRNYYEHIIRDEESLNCVCQYIAENPARWPFDRENPAARA